MKTIPSWKTLGLVLLFGGLLSAASLIHPSPLMAEESLTQTVETAGKAMVDSIKKGLQNTRDYLKSDKFHQDANRFSTDAGKAVKNGGDWLGKKLDEMKK